MMRGSPSRLRKKHPNLVSKCCKRMKKVLCAPPSYLNPQQWDYFVEKAAMRYQLIPFRVGKPKEASKVKAGENTSGPV